MDQIKSAEAEKIIAEKILMERQAEEIQYNLSAESKRLELFKVLSPIILGGLGILGAWMTDIFKISNSVTLLEHKKTVLKETIESLEKEKKVLNQDYANLNSLYKKEQKAMQSVLDSTEKVHASIVDDQLKLVDNLQLKFSSYKEQSIPANSLDEMIGGYRNIIDNANLIVKETKKILLVKEDSLRLLKERYLMDKVLFEKEKSNWLEEEKKLNLERVKNEIIILLMHKKWTIVGYNRLRNLLDNEAHTNDFFDSIIESYNNLFERIKLKDEDDRIGLKLKKESRFFSLEILLAP